MESSINSEGLRPYREILREKIAEKSSEIPKFSLRAFARLTGVDQAFISRVLKGQKHLSKESASKLVGELDFSGNEKEFFFTLIEYEKSKSQTVREMALQKLRQLQPHNRAVTLQLETFRVISDWYHYAIIEMTKVKSIPFTPVEIAKRLGIKPIEAEVAIQRLVDLNLIQVEGETAKKTTAIVQTPTDIPNESLRKFHRSMISKSIDAMDNQNVVERDITSTTIAIPTDRIAGAKKMIEQFQDELSDYLNEGEPSRDSVYQLNVQFFRLDESQN